MNYTQIPEISEDYLSPSHHAVHEPATSTSEVEHGKRNSVIEVAVAANVVAPSNVSARDTRHTSSPVPRCSVSVTLRVSLCEK